MPKIKITEFDNTGSVDLGPVGNVVYIPGKSKSEKNVAPHLFTTKKELDDESSKYDTEDLSYKLAMHLLELGMQVLYEGVKIGTGSPEKEKLGEPVIDWDRLEDKSLYNIRFLTTGGYACPSTKMIACATHRGDCIALLDHKETITTVATVKETLSETLASEYAAAFTPWFKADFTGEGAKSAVEVPASFGYLFAYARAIQNNPTWYAAAGSARGLIPELVSVNVDYTEAEIEELGGRGKDINNLDDNKGCAINTIANVRPFGYVVWGNRTFRNNISGETLKATSFLNVRNLISELKKTLYNVARKYTFEQNSEVLWINFKSEVTPLLDKMKSGNGILGYKMSRLKTNAKARLKAKVVIIPIEAVEDFELEVALEDSLEVIE